MECAAFFPIDNYFASVDSAAGTLLRFPLMSRPILNLTVRFAGTSTRSSVLGFCAILAALVLVSKTPKSRNSKRLSLHNSLVTSSRNAWTISLTITLFAWVRSAIRSISSFFVTVAISHLISRRKDCKLNSAYIRKAAVQNPLTYLPAGLLNSPPHTSAKL